MTTLFFSYSHADAELRDQLETHLAMLKRQGRIDAWHDRQIIAGDNIDDTISSHLDSAGIILLLVSSDFLASSYCYGVEVRRALERSDRGEARVIPVILRACDWKEAPFGRLLATPQEGKPVTRWPDRDEAWLSVVEAIRAALPRAVPTESPPTGATTHRAVPSREPRPRSSNLRVRKEFTDADRARFLKASFEFMARFFENSLEELKARNAGIEGEFTRIDAQLFTAVVFRHGRTAGQCGIRFDPSSHGFTSGITYSTTISERQGSSFNEQLSVEADDQSLFLRPLGLSLGGPSRQDARLTQEGAAELFWGLLIERLR